MSRCSLVVVAALLLVLAPLAVAATPPPVFPTAAPGSPIAVGNTPVGTAEGDFNGDGHTDLAVANAASNSVSILLGTGTGSFTNAPGSPIIVGIGPTSIAVADFNGDNHADLAVTNVVSNSVSILLGNGNGTFNVAPAVPVGVQPQSVTAGTFNGDSNVDLAVANFSSSSVSILLGNGDGTFSPAAPVVVGGLPAAVAVGQFNGDSNTDLAVANSFDNTVSILLGTGTGSFTNAPGSPIAVGVQPVSVAVGEFNGDGHQDLAIADAGSNSVTVLLGNGSGTFTAAPGSPIAVGMTPASVAVGKFNGDAIADLAVSSNTASVSVLLGNGDGTFVAATSSPVPVGNVPQGVAVGRFDPDTTDDFAVANFASDNVSVLLDLIPTHFSLTVPPSPVAGSSTSLTLTILDDQGRVIAPYTGTVNLAFPSSVSGLPSSYTFVSGDNGVHTFANVVFNAAGQQTLTATDSNFAAITGQTTVTVAALASSTTLVPSANPSAPGASVTLTATVAPTTQTTLIPSGTVTFAEGSTSLSTVALVNGKAAFTTSSFTVGIHHLTATYTPDAASGFATSQGSLDLAISNAQLVSITVTPASATVKIGQGQQYTATGAYSDNTTLDITNQVTWSSDATQVAQITSTGKATGVSPGTAHIKATQGSISGQTGVTVAPPIPLGIQPSPIPASRPSSAATFPTQTVTPAPMPATR